jgi:hypothetical protein
MTNGKKVWVKYDPAYVSKYAPLDSGLVPGQKQKYFLVCNAEDGSVFRGTAITEKKDEKDGFVSWHGSCDKDKLIYLETFLGPLTKEQIENQIKSKEKAGVLSQEEVRRANDALAMYQCLRPGEDAPAHDGMKNSMGS